jgi:pimeloyl-ACP methyl ester carboxylesterase
MTNEQQTRHHAGTSYTDAPTRTIAAGGVNFAYRQLGPETGVPVIFLTHLAAVLDNWDPRVVDGIAAKHPVITFDNRGVGTSTGSTPDTIQAMARDAVTFIRALGFDQVNLFGFSMGGMIAQVIAQQEPQLVRKVILAGTGPAGGEGIDKVTRITYLDTARALLTRQDPKQFLFFTRTANGRRAGKEFLARLQERRNDRDNAISVGAFRAQLKAIHRWGRQSLRTSRASASRCSSRTATATRWCPPRTLSTSTGGSRTASSSCIPTPGTAACSSSTRTSSSGLWSFSESSRSAAPGRMSAHDSVADPLRAYDRRSRPAHPAGSSGREPEADEWNETHGAAEMTQY